MGAHCPTKSASWCRSSSFKISEAAIEAPAVHKNASEGSLTVCCSIARAMALRYVQLDLSSTAVRKGMPHWIHLSPLQCSNFSIGTPTSVVHTLIALFMAISDDRFGLGINGRRARNNGSGSDGNTRSSANGPSFSSKPLFI